MTKLQRIHKIKVDYGSDRIAIEANKLLKTNYPTKLINIIIRDIMAAISDEVIINSYIYRLPNGLGMIYVDKKKPFVKRVDGVIRTNKPIDMHSTLKLWESNPEAKEKKIKVRFENYHTDGYVYRLKYSTNKSNFKNKSAYKMRFNRILRQKLHKAIINHQISL